MFQYNDKTIFRSLSSGIKLMLSLSIAIAAFIITDTLTLSYLFLFVVFLLVLAKYKDYHKLILGILPFLIFFSAVFYIFDFKENILQFILFIAVRTLTVFFTFAWFTFTTDLFSVLKMMQQLRVPKSIYLTFYIMMRFLPEIEKDYKEIRDIQKIKGITVRKGVFTFFRSHFIPLIYVLFDRIDELSIAFYLREKDKK